LAQPQKLPFNLLTEPLADVALALQRDAALSLKSPAEQTDAPSDGKATRNPPANG